MDKLDLIREALIKYNEVPENEYAYFYINWDGTEYGLSNPDDEDLFSANNIEDVIDFLKKGIVCWVS